MMLGRELGFSHPNQMLAALTPREFAEVIASLEMYPLRYRRDDLRTAFQTLAVARVAGVKGNPGVEMFLLRDAVDKPDRHVRMSDSDVRRNLEAWFEAKRVHVRRKA